jgi:transposase
MTLKNYPSDVTNDEWAFVAPYLCLMRLDAPQRDHDLRAVFNGVRYLVRTGAPWRYLPGDFPPWAAVYQQTQRWLKAGGFAAIVHDLRELLRTAAGRAPQPTAAIFDGRTMQSSPESGARAGYDGHKRKNGSKVHMAVDTLGHRLALLPGPRRCRSPPGRAWKAPSWTKATPGRNRRKPRRSTGSTWKWCSCQRPSAASCCCPAAGWWSAASPGRRGFGAWPGTMSGCQRR